MTSILAIKKEIDGVTRVIWGTDSLFTEYSRKVLIKNNHKYAEFPEFLVLFAGSASVQQVLDELKHSKAALKKPYMKMRNRVDVHKFASDVTGKLRRKLKDLGAPEDQGHDFQMIIVTPKKLYESDWWAFISEADYLTGGSGGDLLQAVLLLEYASVTTLSGLHDLAERALGIACQIDLYSGPPIIVREFRRTSETKPIQQRDFEPYPAQ